MTKISQKVFLKVLGSNESGYSGDTPNQRGKFVLVPKYAYEVFPPLLSTKVLNYQKPIFCNDIAGQRVAVNLVHHNAKFFPALGLKRDHNEVRMYRNTALDEALNLDRYVVIAFIKTNVVGEYKVFSVVPGSDDYNRWKELAEQEKIFDHSDLMREKIFRDVFSFRIEQTDNIINQGEIIQHVTSMVAKQRQQQPGLDDDPALVLSTLIKTQKHFSDYLRQAYGGKCAIRGTALIQNHYTGLDAAHIQPHTHGGPLLPTNGFLVSMDLHHAFDRGAFTLDANNAVQINKGVPNGSLLKKYAGIIIKPKPEYEIFKPYHGYVDFHTSEVYDNYKNP